MTAVLRYRPRALARSGLEAAIGLGATAGALALMPLPLPVALVFGLGACVFAAHGLNTVARARVRIALDDDGIALGRRRLAWTDLAELDLAFYSTRRDGGRGWMRLRLAGRGARIVVDSGLAGFADVTAAAVRAARARGLALGARTLANLASLGRQEAFDTR